MILYQVARRANRYLKDVKKQKAGRYLSPVRRIERVYPVKGQRVCAMTFDDGPYNMPPSQDKASDTPLTKRLCDVLSSYGFTATFDVVGDTSENYPDDKGREGTAYWGGKRFDHYPDYGMDKLGGAYNCPELIEYLLNAGMELSNHGYRHMISAPVRAVYGKRAHFENLGEVVSDLKRLNDYIEEKFGYQMKLARPPHYIDRIPGGFTVYDAYELMGYDYMAASFDGGGWLAKGGCEADAKAMAKRIERALSDDEDCLNGQIIFQKDGCNMRRETPIADALEPQLKSLKARGYRVVSVSELMKLSPFEDLSADEACFEAVRELTEKGFITGYKNNTFQPGRMLTFGELCAMLCPRAAFSRRVLMLAEGKKSINGIPLSHPYASAIDWAWSGGVFSKPEDHVDGKLMERMLKLLGFEPDISREGLYDRGRAAIEIHRHAK